PGKNPRAGELGPAPRPPPPAHPGMPSARLGGADGLQWPCYDESHRGEMSLHGRLWQRPIVGPRAPFAVVQDDPPVEALSDEFPLRLTTGRRLDSYNTGVQTGLFASPLRRRESLDLAPEDAKRLGVEEGEIVRVVSRRGAVLAPARLDPGLKPGLAFMTFHFPDQVAVNELTVDAVDPLSGTSEFKATAVRVERVGEEVAAAFAAAVAPEPAPVSA